MMRRLGFFTILTTLACLFLAACGQDAQIVTNSPINISSTTSSNPIVVTPTVASVPTSQAKPVVSYNAPDFTVQELNGQTLTLSSLRGKVVLINFWGVY
jgi:cytochrome oxidase Cu insertion factor (SCO1/SenC/PrrC family)